jgi:hypothetical protein
MQMRQVKFPGEALRLFVVDSSLAGAIRCGQLYYVLPTTEL